VEASEPQLSSLPTARATSADVARLAGVSRAAVSQILNGRGQRFSAATRERVNQVAKSLAYEPSAAARTLVRGRSDLVVAVIPHTTFGTNLQDIFDVLTRELSAAGFTLVLRFSASSPESFDKLIASMRPAAVLPFGPLSEAESGVLTTRRVPVLTPTESLGRRDGQQAIGALQAGHLIERGHRRLSYARLKDARQDPYSPGRLRGFSERCRDLGHSEPVVMQVSIDLEDATAELVRHGPGMAVACYNDDVAVTLVAAASRLGWQVPGDLAVIGVDNTPLARVLSPRISTVAYDSSGIAADLAGAVVAQLVEGEPRRPMNVRYSVFQGETT
jgi:DNA-binding LacI/PurR family transcriptional regulator